MSRGEQTRVEAGAAHAEHETKFVLDAALAPRLLRWLERRCRPDPRFPAGWVSSLYYDTPDWRFLREKLNSDFYKTKVRIRWYDDLDAGRSDGAAFLEAKFRTGARREKVRVPIEESGAWLASVPLHSPRLLAIPRRLGSKSVVLGGALLPTLRIRYRRRRFVEPATGARLSLDDAIGVSGVNRQMVARSYPVGLRQAVFELKGGRIELPEVLHQLTALGCRKESFSKYARCHEHVMGIAF